MFEFLFYLGFVVYAILTLAGVGRYLEKPDSTAPEAIAYTILLPYLVVRAFPKVWKEVRSDDNRPVRPADGGRGS